MFLATLTGIAAYICTQALFGIIYGLACGNSQTLFVLLRFSPFALPIRIACWAVAACAGWGVGAAMLG
jgi:hypothetical protein